MRLIYHDGEQLYASDGQSVGAYVYQRKARLDMGLEVAPASAQRRAEMWDAASRLSFETKADCARILAWASLAPFCGALPARPAIFLTGASKSGKSTVLDYIVAPLAHPRRYSGVSTATGIRQEVGNDAGPVLIDEAESHDEDSRKRMNDHFELVRQSVFPNSPKIVKGSTSQRAQSFETSSMYMYGAITPGLERIADLSRILVVDMVRPEADGRWMDLRTSLLDAFCPANCAAVRAFVWSRLPEIIQAVDSFTLATEASGLSSRDALIDAMLWTAHWMVWKDRIPEEAELGAWLEKAYTAKPHEEPEDDAEAMLSRLLSEPAAVYGEPGKRPTIEHLLACVLSSYDPTDTGASIEHYRKTCSSLGMYIIKREGRPEELAIRIRHSGIARILQAPLSYHVTMARHPLCQAKDHPVTQDGPTKRCIIFSAGVLEGEPPI